MAARAATTRPRLVAAKCRLVPGLLFPRLVCLARFALAATGSTIASSPLRGKAGRFPAALRGRGDPGRQRPRRPASRRRGTARRAYIPTATLSGALSLSFFRARFSICRTVSGEMPSSVPMRLSVYFSPPKNSKR